MNYYDYGDNPFMRSDIIDEIMKNIEAQNRQTMGMAPLYRQDQQQGGGGPSMSNAMDIWQKISSSGGGAETGAASTGGEASGALAAPEAAGGAEGGFMGGGMAGAGGVAAIIAAIAALEHMASNSTNKTFEGVKTDDAFSAHFFTDPGIAWATPNTVTPGEKMDAAIANGDWGDALKRMPEAAHYWADPGSGIAGELGAEYLGKDSKWFINPIGSLLGLIGG